MATAALSSPHASPPWTDLPSDLTENILQRLGSAEILQTAQYVCATWWKVCLNPSMWRVIKIVNNDHNRIKMIAMMCRRAVDRSQGQLIDLTIAHFGDNKLLNYIVDRSSNLQRLTLAYCSDISATALIEAVKKLHKLEELHLFLPIKAADIEAIGNICPMLKSFTFTVEDISFLMGIMVSGFTWPSPPRTCNKEALAIAKTMPNLYHLDNELDNEGLQAILDGCPHLESLDLRQCSSVDLRGPLGERCCKQIKHIKLPSHDSIADYEWLRYNHKQSSYFQRKYFPRNNREFAAILFRHGVR